jgi:hypothetical protein
MIRKTPVKIIVISSDLASLIAYGIIPLFKLIRMFAGRRSVNLACFGQRYKREIGYGLKFRRLALLFA